jgi:hypothetical protein
MFFFFLDDLLQRPPSVFGGTGKHFCDSPQRHPPAFGETGNDFFQTRQNPACMRGLDLTPVA